MSMFDWPRGWRLPGRLAARRHADPARPVPPQMVRGARPLEPRDFDVIYIRAGRRVCAGHAEGLVVWHGDDPCFVCGAPGYGAMEG